MNERERRMLLVGVIAAVAILVLTYGTKGMDRWSRSHAALTAAQKKLGEVETDKTKLAAVMALVPVFDPPQAQEKQTTLFREKLLAQLKKSGLNTEPPQPLLGKKIVVAGTTYQMLKIKCKAKCKFDQLLDFLGDLKENPYFVGVEELQFRCDMKNPAEKRKDKDVDVDLVVSTFMRDSGVKRADTRAVRNAITSSR